MLFAVVLPEPVVVNSLKYQESREAAKTLRNRKEV